MNSFDQIWESSRFNVWSPLYPTVVAVGVLVLIGLSFVKPTIKRRSLKVVSAIALAVLAAQASSLEISEKWRIRHEWTDAHSSELTQEQQQARITDGANIVLGPIAFGIQALLIFGGVLLAVSIVSRLRPRDDSFLLLKQQEDYERRL